MSAAAYYNEIDPFAAQWLRNLIAGGHIAPGEVDERSIEDVTPDDLRGFTQCHFFAGIGVWSHSLRLAGWPDDKPVWTGSCPCQPFSAAGKGDGFADERHLWPAFQWLIAQCSPDVVFGEQVASKDGLNWLDTVQTDLEGTGYTSAALDLCSAGFGAPHVRQRLYWLAHRHRQQHENSDTRSGEDYAAQSRWPAAEPAGHCATGHMDNSERQRQQARRHRDYTGHDGQQPGAAGENGGLEHSDGFGFEGRLSGWQDPGRETFDRPTGCDSSTVRPLEVNGFWRAADWISCRDGWYRPVEPGTFPLVDGATARMGRVESRVARVASSNRVGRLKGYGNAINAQAAAAFIRAYMGVT
ncbi:DNA-cytosine methyltransferase [Raoultella ornithinolytica]|uniref:DNA cytosine methyltransferase n=1 Tax=Raoultella ornithinolytica TaxID=54291 RepID=UPI00071EE35B|nr:DNA cytosine methyltransferase [Raoultella ornithinolytica]ALQ48109.1 DNA-cytosine methyltransferase [Raoultella ornithinolytica]